MSGQTALRRIQWLNEQVLAKEDPIPLEQIERFGKNPHVMLPDDAVAIERLPPQYKVEQCVRNGESVVFTGVREDRAMVIASMTAELVCGRCYHLLGMSNGQPIWTKSHGFDVSDIMLMSSDNTAWRDMSANWELKIGDRTVLKTTGVTATLLLKDGTVLFAQKTETLDIYRICKWNDGKVTECVTLEHRPFQRFVETSNGVYGVYYHQSLGGIHRNKIGRIDTPNHGVDVRSIDFTLLPDGREAHEEVARHAQRRWSFHSKQEGVAPQEGPAFLWVSDIFDHSKHSLCYIGRIGNHIVTMQVPTCKTLKMPKRI